MAAGLFCISFTTQPVRCSAAVRRRTGRQRTRTATRCTRSRRTVRRRRELRSAAPSTASTARTPDTTVRCSCGRWLANWWRPRAERYRRARPAWRPPSVRRWPKRPRPAERRQTGGEECSKRIAMLMVVVVSSAMRFDVRQTYNFEHDCCGSGCVGGVVRGVVVLLMCTC